MESKFKPFFQVIPVLSDTISSSFDYDPDPALEESDENDDNDPILP